LMNGLGAQVSNYFSISSSLQYVVTKIRECGDRRAIEAELERIAQKSEEMRSIAGFSDEETEQYRTAEQTEVAANARLKSAQRVEAVMKLAVAEIPEILKETLDRIDAVVADAIEEQGLEETETQEVLSHAARLKEAIEAADIAFLEGAIRATGILTAATEEASEGAHAAGLALKPFLDKIENQKELKELQERNIQLGLLLEEIGGYEKEKEQIEKKYRASVQEIERLISERFANQERVIQLFNDPTYCEVGDGIVISAEMVFEKERFITDFFGCFDQRHSLSWLSDHFLNNSVEWAKEKHVEIVASVFRKLVKTAEDDLGLRSGQSQRNVVEVLLRDYLSYAFTVKQAGDDIFRMSPGKQGLILLEILLHMSNSAYPVLIDQPEDNLDNRTVYSHLVHFIRRKKIDRQIIIVTHNPNLVLGADAEQVIVANQDGEGQGDNAEFRFEYVSGSIECSFRHASAGPVLKSQGIREHVCQVLEGGEDAFRKREEKYCLTFGGQN